MKSGAACTLEDLAPEARAKLDAARRRYVDALREVAEIAARQPGYDGAPPEMVASKADERGAVRQRNVREHPLDLMWHKKQIDVVQYSAGDILRRDYELSQISPVRGRDFAMLRAATVTGGDAPRRKPGRAAAEAEVALARPGPVTFPPRMGSRQPFVWRDVAGVTLDAMARVTRARSALGEVSAEARAVGVAHASGASVAALVADRGPRARDLLREAMDVAAMVAIVEAVCRDRRSIVEIAETGAMGVRNRNRIGRLLRAGLGRLAVHYGIASPGIGRRIDGVTYIEREREDA